MIQKKYNSNLLAVKCANFVSPEIYEWIVKYKEDLRVGKVYWEKGIAPET